MRAKEFIIEGKRKRRRSRRAAYGPGPYGGYGYAVGYSGNGGEAGDGVGEDQHPNEKPKGPETKPTMPKGTVKVDVSDVYDWYKLGQHVSDLKGLGKHDFGKGPPSTIMAFGDEDEEHKYIKNLKKTGLTTTDIDPKAHEKKKGQKVDRTYNVGENFADGKKPGRKGLAKRSGVNCKQSVSKLRSIAKNSSGERQRMAHWCANMKSGRKEDIQNMSEYGTDGGWTRREIIWSKKNPPPLEWLYRQFLQDLLSPENKITPQDWIKSQNDRYGLNYTLQDYRNFGHKDYTNSWDKFVQKFVLGR